MFRVGIISFSSGKRIARRIFSLLEEEKSISVSTAVWSGRSTLSVERFIAKLDFLIVLWSRPKRTLVERLKRVLSSASVGTPHVNDYPPKIFELYKNGRLFPVSIDGFYPDDEFGEAQGPQLSSPSYIDKMEVAYLAMYEKLMHVCGNPELAYGARKKLDFVRRVKEDRELERTITKAERRRYDYRELSDLVSAVGDGIRDFRPEVLFSFDSRGGIWAQLIVERLGLNAPVIIGFRLKPTGPRKPSIQSCFEQCHLIETYSRSAAQPNKARWHLLVPPALIRLPNNKRVLFVDDYTSSGDTCWAIKQFLVGERGFPEESVRTLALVSTEGTAAEGRLPDFSPHITPAMRADLFYMFRR